MYVSTSRFRWWAKKTRKWGWTEKVTESWLLGGKMVGQTYSSSPITPEEILRECLQNLPGSDACRSLESSSQLLHFLDKYLKVMSCSLRRLICSVGCVLCRLDRWWLQIALCGLLIRGDVKGGLDPCGHTGAARTGSRGVNHLVTLV